MTTQLLIYQNIVPVSKQKHENWYIKPTNSYEFAREINAVPLTLVEFVRASSEYPIVFTGTEDAVMPAVVLGVKNQQNLYLNPDNSWRTKYIPAFIQRYPFVFSSQDQQQFTLCLDESYAGWNQEGRGERLFDAEGEQTQYLKTIVEFLRQYQVQFQRTQIFCKKIKELDLIEPMKVQMRIGEKEPASLTGFSVISRERLKKLNAEQVHGLFQTDELELIFRHLYSLDKFSELVEQFRSQDGSSETVIPEVVESAS
ncbi:MAG: SapC family protein [Cyanobacteria bacterium P01_H01_bin.15]